MLDWRDETAADLKDAESRMAALSESVSGEPSSEQLASIWWAYLDIEKSVVFIKVELDEENPGKLVNVKFYRVDDERQAIRFALASLRKGAAEFGAGNLKESLKALRESRNYLRVLLKEKRKLRVKRVSAAVRV